MSRQPKRELPLKMPNIKPTADDEGKCSVICSHTPICADSESCIRRTMEYAMGVRRKP